ncbi:MAG: peptide ABC transporter substrate-binding protein, partial [Pseudomonadota bacterium]
MRFSTSRRKALAGVIGGLGAAGLASCGKAAIIGLDKRARSLDIAIQDEPLTLDPQKCSAPAENLIVGNMFMGLFAENARAEPIPGMAERWEVSEDGLTWTFFLRPATWSDGVRCDAHDFVYAFRRILDPAHAAEYARLLFPLKNAAQVNKGEAPPSAVGVAALGDRILEIQLEHPTPLLPQVLKHHVAYPAPKHVLEAHGDDWIKAENIVVNGPYTLVKWWSNYVVHLRKNPHFLDAGQVRLNDLYFYPTANAASAARGVESGARGWSTDFPSDRYNDLERRLSAYVRVAPNLLTECFFFNCTRAPFDDPRVRQALCMSLDRDFIFSRV